MPRKKGSGKKNKDKGQQPAASEPAKAPEAQPTVPQSAGTPFSRPIPTAQKPPENAS